MSLIKDTWRQIVQRRLWPIALVLLAALVAVPVLLAQSPAPAPAPTAPTAAAGDSATADETIATPVVAVATGDDRRRHVLGDSKDPFRPEATPTPTPTPVSKSSGTSDKSSANGGGDGSTPATGGSTAPGTSTPATPGGDTKPKSYPADSLTVRFGTGEGDAKSVLQVGEPLPGAAADETATPVLVYLGLTKSGKQARFLLDAGVVADGDGRCVSGGGTACETLYLSAHETEFLDVTGDDGTVTAQYQLDLVAIHRSAKAARAAKAAEARKSVAAASAHVSRAGTASTGPAAVGLAGIARLLGHL
jgi:hypothetical protein